MGDKDRLVFPTHVGVNRVCHVSLYCTCCFPHTRGGEPRGKMPLHRIAKFSPHTWG